MAVSDPGVAQSSGPGPADGETGPGAPGSVAERIAQARLHPSSDEVPVLHTAWLTALASEPPVSRVAALGQTAQTAMRLGQARECLAALAEQREAAGDDPALQVWALTASCVCRSVFGQLRCARADLAQARQACNNAAPLLAEPFWRFAETACNWLGGSWAAALAGATALDEADASQFPHPLRGTVVALRVELLRGLGLTRDCRQLAAGLAGRSRPR